MTSAVRKWGRIQRAKIPQWSKTRRRILACAWAGGDSYDAAVSFFSPSGSSALRFHRASPPTSLCYSSSPPPPRPPHHFLISCAFFAGATCAAAVRWSGTIVRDRARGRHDGGRQAEGVVKLLHHGQDYSSCSTGACYLRNCWCSLHRSGSCVFPSSRLL